MVNSTEGLTQARENLPAATALISRKLPVAKESESPFRSFGLAVSESLSAFPKHESVWRTPSAAFHDSDERELSYKAAANSKKPLARWIPELYLLIVILLPEDFIHHENPEGHEERTTERAAKERFHPSRFVVVSIFPKP